VTADAPAPADLRAELGAVPVRRDVVRVSGPDAVAYLQGQLSQDVAGLAAGATSWSFVLQPTGKVDAWVRVTRTADDEVLLDADPGTGPALLGRLRRFLLRTKAEVEALDWPAVALRGPGAAEAAGRVLAAAGGGADAPGRPVLALPAGWPGAEGVDLLGPGAVVPEGVAEADAAAYESLRLRSGVPALGAELTERTIPAEAGQWVIDASVSFTKGCFTGQELVARIDSRGGHVPRRLHALVAPGGEDLPVDAPVVVDGAEVGRVTSAAPAPGGGTVALAYVGRGVTAPSAAEVRTGGGDERSVPVTVLATPLAD